MTGTFILQPFFLTCYWELFMELGTFFGYSPQLAEFYFNSESLISLGFFWARIICFVNRYILFLQHLKIFPSVNPITLTKLCKIIFTIAIVDTDVLFFFFFFLLGSTLIFFLRKKNPNTNSSQHFNNKVLA